MEKIMFKYIITASLLMSATSPLLAAAPRESARSVRVSHADLDLSNASDRAKLERRIGRAATRVCDPEAIRRFGVRTRSLPCARQTSAAALQLLQDRVARGLKPRRMEAQPLAAR